MENFFISSSYQNLETLLNFYFFYQAVWKWLGRRKRSEGVWKGDDRELHKKEDGGGGTNTETDH